MKKKYEIVDIKNLLFVFDIENTHDIVRERLIAERNVNDLQHLKELFDTLLKPEFYEYTDKEQESLINTVDHFLDQNDNFDAVFNRMTTYFGTEVADRPSFMRVLLECLKKYREEQGPGC
ncbi:Uncharacterised protein [Pseudomonas fluorescens]|uniref:CdiI immunity protein domain-containing protein n=1 Tax=Pseudomonas fluorescens TaxID=294 RepID=A0A448DTH8_PSEFL|nr:hypothetical protein [Pseudomonas fluorescens]VEF10078.1 Uncharacterised protein [Pseudomonas fluorescens]